MNAARRVDGLEGVLVDLAEHDIASLEPAIDPRVVRAVAAMATAAQPVMDADHVRVTCEALAGDLLEVLKP